MYEAKIENLSIISFGKASTFQLQYFLLFSVKNLLSETSPAFRLPFLLDLEQKRSIILALSIFCKNHWHLPFIRESKLRPAYFQLFPRACIDTLILLDCLWDVFWYEPFVGTLYQWNNAAFKNVNPSDFFKVSTMWSIKKYSYVKDRAQKAFPMYSLSTVSTLLYFETDTPF